MTPRHQPPHGRRGFSLLELLIALGISFFIFLIMCAILVPGIKTCRATTLSLDLTQNARVGVARIAREIRSSPKIATQLPDVPDDPSMPVSHTIMFRDGRSDSLRYVSYYQSGDELRRRIYTYHLPGDSSTPVAFNDYDEFDQPAVPTLNEDVAIAQYVSDLQFWGVNPVNITITFDYHGKHLQCSEAAAVRNRATPQ
jgi:type II secretory pathway pseudopilin PulG